MQRLRRRLMWGFAAATGASLVLVGPASTPSRWPVPVDISSPEGQALLHSSRPKTGVLDPRTGKITALYAGFVALPPAASEELVRPPWLVGGPSAGE
jgi:hypothetical protein